MSRLQDRKIAELAAQYPGTDYDVSVYGKDNELTLHVDNGSFTVARYTIDELGGSALAFPPYADEIDDRIVSYLERADSEAREAESERQRAQRRLDSRLATVKSLEDLLAARNDATVTA